MAGELLEVCADPASLPHPPWHPDATPPRGKVLLEQHYPLIRQELSRLGWLSGLPADEAEDFRSWALLKLIENDYRALASWQGRSSFPTFLGVVLANLMKDYRTRLWGKWRPSAAARRQGPPAVLLERLWFRDNLTLEEAIERMLSEPKISLSRSEIERMAASLRRRPEPWRVSRVSEEELLRIAIDGKVESRIQDGERALLEERLQELLAPLLQSLPPQDRLILKLHYWDGFSMATISRLLDRPQKKLYIVRDQCLRKLRRQLEEKGVESGRVRDTFGHSCLDLALEGL
jgi:RNA polymerase sigma factor (sigma-70 family)